MTHTKNTPNVTCDNCGKQFRKRPSKIGVRNYCSNECYHSRNRRRPVDNGDGTASLPLTQGYVAIIDSADIDRVSRHSWSVLPFPDGRVYVMCKWEGRNMYLHRFLLGATPDNVVDHINGNQLDNRRENLRLCTQMENVWNSRGHRDARSAFRGVSTCGRQWVAYITASGRHYRLGRFATEVEAARAYDAAAIELHGEFAHLNFPHD